MILCATCETWQHAVCFAIRKSADAPVSHICATCAMVCCIKQRHF